MGCETVCLGRVCRQSATVWTPHVHTNRPVSARNSSRLARQAAQAILRADSRGGLQEAVDSHSHIRWAKVLGGRLRMVHTPRQHPAMRVLLGLLWEVCALSFGLVNRAVAVDIDGKKPRQCLLPSFAQQSLQRRTVRHQHSVPHSQDLPWTCSFGTVVGKSPIPGGDADCEPC